MYLNLDTRTVIILSSGHVSKATATMFNTRSCLDWPCLGGPYGDYGWFVYAHEENTGTDDKHIPDDVFNVMLWARRCRAEYILFDRDGEQIAELPFFDW